MDDQGQRVLGLNRDSPVAIAWGADQVTLYNDAYARLLGAKPQQGIGLPFRQLFPEVWQRIGSLMERVMERGESALLENQLFCIYRNGFAEETYLSFICKPDDDAANGRGVMVMVEETTDQLISARRAAALRDISAAGAQASSVEDACDDALNAMSRHSTDIPFALLYARNASKRQARLVASAGLPAGISASPRILAFDSTAEAVSWPIAPALEANRTVIVDDLLTRFEPLPAGDWPLAPKSAVIIPLATRALDRADGFLILGVSARRELDASYLDFIELVAKQVVAVIVAGRLREEAERNAVNRAAANVARTKSRARTRAVKAKVAGVLEERTRLAREIHDTLLQDVTGIALQLRAALPHLRSSPYAALTTLERVADLAENTSREARQVVWDMRPGALDEEEFVRAVQITAQRAVAGGPIALHFASRGTARRVDDDAQRVVLRIVQEAAANVVRHAAASAIRVTLSFRPRQLRVTIADDGRGFTVEPDFRSYAGHWGLVGMQERADQVGASLRLQSAPRRGTTVTFELPLRATRAKSALVTRQEREPAIA